MLSSVLKNKVKLKNYLTCYLNKTKTLFSSTHQEKEPSKLEEPKLMNVISTLKTSNLISQNNNLRKIILDMEILLAANSPILEQLP